MSRRRVETQTRSHPESARAMAHHSAVRSFLDRHGFSDVDRPRDLDESVPHRIQMEPVYPIEVASALGKEAMVNMLLDAGAISNPRARQSPSLTSSSSSTSGSCCQSFASWPGTASTTRFAASPPTSPHRLHGTCEVALLPRLLRWLVRLVIEGNYPFLPCGSKCRYYKCAAKETFPTSSAGNEQLQQILSFGPFGSQRHRF